MSAVTFDLQGKRRAELLRLARACGDRYFDPARRICLIERDTIWYAIALLSDEDERQRDLGRALLGETPSVDGTHTPATLLAILHTHGLELAPELRVTLEGRVRSQLVAAAGVGWHDGNVNHPLGAWATLILGGEMCNEPWAVELGVQALARFRAVTGDRRHTGRRQADMSEYHSPTYTALDFCFLALIAEHARDARARRLAAFLEAGLWRLTALHYHAPSAQFAGPFSRAYQDDSSGGYSGLHSIWYAVFDRQDVYIDPSIAQQFEHPSAYLQNCLVALTPFHPPSDVETCVIHKPLPFELRRSTYGEAYHENAAGSGFDTDVYPGGWAELTTYLSEHFALGTASSPYVNGAHSDAIVLRIARRSPISGRGDFRSLFTRGVYNDAHFGQGNPFHCTGGVTDASYYPEQGRPFTVQHDGSALVMYAAKRSGHKGVTSFRVELVFGFDEPFRRLRIGDRDVTDFPAEGKAGERILFDDGTVYGLIVPLTAAPVPEEAGWTAAVRAGHLVIGLHNLRHAPRDYRRDEVSTWRNGFAIHIVEASAYPDFEAFAASCDDILVEEFVNADGTRCATMRGRVALLLRADTRAERVVERRVGGEELDWTHWHIESDDEALRHMPAPFGREVWEDFDAEP